MASLCTATLTQVNGRSIESRKVHTTLCTPSVPASRRRGLIAEVLSRFFRRQVAVQTPARRIDHRVEISCPYSSLAVARGGDEDFLVGAEGCRVHEVAGIDPGNFLPCPGVPQPSRLVATGGKHGRALFIEHSRKNVVIVQKPGDDRKVGDRPNLDHMLCRTRYQQ